MSKLHDPESMNYEPLNSLSVRVRTFINYILAGHTRLQSMKNAGFYASDADLEIMAETLLDRSIVDIELKKRRAIQLARSDIDHTRVINELASIAFFDPIELYDSDGQYLPIHKIPERARRALEVFASGVSVSGIKVHSKIKALEMLGNYLGMFKSGDSRGGENKQPAMIAPYDIEARANQLLESAKDNKDKGALDAILA